MTKENQKESAAAKSKNSGRRKRGETGGGDASSEAGDALTELESGGDAEADIGEPQGDNAKPKSKPRAKAKSKAARPTASSRKSKTGGAGKESMSDLPDAEAAAGNGEGSSGAMSSDDVIELGAAKSEDKDQDSSQAETASDKDAPAATDAGDAGAELKSDGKEQSDSRPSEPEEPPVEIPELIDLNEFQKKPLAEMQRIAAEIGLRVAGVRSKHQLVFEILCWFGRHGAGIEATGLIDITSDSHSFLRWPDLSFNSNVDDVYCAAQFLREHKLKPGHLVRAAVRPPREREKFLSVERLLEIEGQAADEWQTPVDFDELTALYPSERLILEYPDCPSPSPRVVDLLAPLGKGQRGLIVAPPRAGKTILLKSIAVSIQKNHPEVELIVLLLDERPEEVTDFRETVDAPVFSSTFDEPSRRHVQVSDMVAERARRLVEQKKDVVILLDSLTRLARGHNVNIGSKGGRTGSGGLDTKALQRPRKFFGAARNVEEGGSLTILATCLVETDSRMDEVIFEEFKGTGNMEIYLDRELAEKRIFPAIHGLKSGTRKDELLYHADEFKRISSLRRELIQLPAGEAMEKLIKNINLTSSNAELLLRGLSLR